MYIIQGLKLYDYYKLLNLPLGSPKEMVLEAHDAMVNEWYEKPTKKSSIDELDKVLDQALFILTNPVRKEAYDRILLKYYLQKSQKEQHRKYGMSCKNPWMPDLAEQQSDSKESEEELPPRPQLKTNIVRSAVILTLLLVIGTYLFWQVYTAGVLISAVFLFGSYVIFGVFALNNVSQYFSVRELVEPKITASRAVTYAATLVFVAIPFMLIQGARSLPNAMLTENSPVTQVVELETETMWANAKFATKNGLERISLAYPANLSDRFMKLKMTEGKVFVKYHKSWPFLASWKIVE